VLFRGLLREMGERATVFVSTHLVEDVAIACNEVAIMEAGAIVFRGNPVDLTDLGAVPGEGGGDSAIERGYGSVLASVRGRTH